MKGEFNGIEVETTETGFLVNLEDWNEDIAKVIAAQEEIELTKKHWDVINYLRDEFINNKENQPNTRNMVKTKVGTIIKIASFLALLERPLYVFQFNIIGPKSL